MLNHILFAVALLLFLTTGTAQRVRLVGGDSRHEGRVEVYYRGTWGTVCDDSFTNAAARVVCYMLGYGRVGWFIGNRYGAGSGTIWLDNVQCRGTETDIVYCSHNSWGSHNCGHSEDVSVSCSITVRLVAGRSPREGRVEVYHNGNWGTVCDGRFTDAAASVVCYSLGYGYVGRSIGNLYGAGSGTIWLDNIRCSGSESHITECPHNGWGSHNCQHSDDVSVSCIADSAVAVALVGGVNPRVGRLEVFHGNQWGTVCDDGFTDAAARVVCYSIGFGYVGRKMDVVIYGEGGGLIWLNHVVCNGTEQYIGECSHDDWGAWNCTHHQDVAVSCYSTSVTQVRLVGGSNSTGRLEVLHNGVWGTVCDDLFTAFEARVVCMMLGFDSGTKTDNHNYATSDGPIWLDDVRCNGTETDIAECSHNGWGVHNCQHREDVAISCARVQVRLNGGRDPREGRLEVLYNGSWRGVCGSGFNYTAARVVCNVLGFGYIGKPSRNSYVYGFRSGPIWLSELWCNGTEKNIAECSWSISSNCLPGKEEAISCLTDDAVALFGGESPREGRLEVYHDDRWGTVCDDGFTDAAARIVCYSLGFGNVGREMNIDVYGVGQGQIWLDDVQCDGAERHIGECSHGGWGVHNCVHREDVAVSCAGESPPASTASSSSLNSTVRSTSSESSPTSRTAVSTPSSPMSSVSAATSTTTPSPVFNSSSSKLPQTSRASSPSATSTTLMASSPLSVSHTRSIQSGNNNDNSDIIIAIAVVACLLFIVCVIVIGFVVVVACKVFRNEVQFPRNPRRAPTESAVIPMHVTASSNTYREASTDTAKSGNSADNTQACNNEDFQQPSADVAGAVGGVGTGDIEYELQPSAVYESLDDQRHSSQVQPSYETLKKATHASKN